MTMPARVLNGPNTSIMVQWTGAPSAGARVGQALDDLFSKASGDEIDRTPEYRAYTAHQLRVVNASDLAGAHVDASVTHASVGSNFWSSFHQDGVRSAGPILHARIQDLEAAVAKLDTLSPSIARSTTSFLPDLDVVTHGQIQVIANAADGASRVFRFGPSDAVPEGIQNVVRAATRVASRI